MASYTLVIYLRTEGNLSCINTRNTNLITIVRNIQLNIKGELSDKDILDRELKFLKNFYGVIKFRYTILPDDTVQHYIENVDKLTEDELKTTKIIHGKDGDREVTFQRKLIECKRVNDGNEAHEVYLIKNALTKDMISDFMNEYPEMTSFDYTDAQPKEVKPRAKKEKEDKPHVEGKKVTKIDGKKSAAKPKAAAAAAKPKAAATKGKKPTKKEEPVQEVEPEEADEADDEIVEEENADE